MLESHWFPVMDSERADVQKKVFNYIPTQRSGIRPKEDKQVNVEL